MKKILLFGLVFILFSLSANAYLCNQEGFIKSTNASDYLVYENCDSSSGEFNSTYFDINNIALSGNDGEFCRVNGTDSWGDAFVNTYQGYGSGGDFTIELSFRGNSTDLNIISFDSPNTYSQGLLGTKASDPTYYGEYFTVANTFTDIPNIPNDWNIANPQFKNVTIYVKNATELKYYWTENNSNFLNTTYYNTDTRHNISNVIGLNNFRSAGHIVYDYIYIYNSSSCVWGGTPTAIFNSTPIEATNETFIYSINNSGFDVSEISASLFYNGSIYSGTKTSGGGLTNITFGVSLPEVTSGGDIKTFKFNYTIDGINSINSTEYSHTILNSIFDNCTIANQTTLTLKSYDENNPSAPLITSIEAVIEYWTEDKELSRNNSFVANNSDTFNLCLSPNSSNVFADIYVKHTTANGFTHRYYIVNGSFSNATQVVNLYNFDGQTGISDLRGTTRDNADYTYYSNVIAKLLRYYPGENAYRVVQMDKSGDFGTIFFNIIEENTDYKFTFQDLDNNVLKNTDAMKFTCNGAVCELTFLLDRAGSVTTSTNLTLDYIYNNNTQIATVSWNDPTGLTSSVRVWVLKESMSGTGTICDQTVAGATGSINCDTSGFEGTLILKAYSSASPESARLSKFIEKTRQTFTDLNFMDKKEGAFITAMLAVTVGMMGIFSLVGAVVMFIVGLIFSFFLGFNSVANITFISIVCVLGIMIGLKVRN